MLHSEKLKALLVNKEAVCSNKIKKLKRRIKFIKILSVSISVSTIIILAILASSLVLSPLAVSILAVISGSLVGIDCKFKFENKSFEKKQLIDKLDIIQRKLEYINSCNGGLTEEQYIELFKEFNVL